MLGELPTLATLDAAKQAPQVARERLRGPLRAETSAN